MPVLGRQKDKSVVVQNEAEPLSNAGDSNTARCSIGAVTLRKIASLPCVRKDKVLAVRQQLAEGTYDLDKRLDAAVDRFLAAVTT